MNTSNSKREKILATFKDTIEKSTVHGIPRIIRSRNKVVTVLWILCFLASFGYCIFTLIKSIRQYSNYDVVLSETIQRDSTTEFPAVTICNLKTFIPYNISVKYKEYFSNFMKEYAKTHDYFDYNSYSNTDNNLWIKWNRVDAKNPKVLMDKYFGQAKRIFASQKRKDEEFFKDFGFDLEKEMLLGCTFNNVPCNASQFSSFWNNEYGKCYTFNNGRDANNTEQEILKTSRSGLGYGLELELLLGTPFKYELFSLKSGMYVVVHNKSTPPPLLTGGIHAAAGFDTYIPIKRTFNNKLSSPYSDCIQNMNQYKKLSPYSKKLNSYMEYLNLTEYNQGFCYKLCFQDKLIKECNCSEYTIPILNNVDYCKSDAELDCLTRVLQTFASNLEELCEISCPQECTRWEYDLSSHVAFFPSLYYYAELQKAGYYTTNLPLKMLFNWSNILFNLNIFDWYDKYEIIRRSFVKISVNYEDLSYKVISESPAITSETLFGILGGQLSLFIGTSILSVIEIVDLIIQLVWRGWISKK